MASRAHRAPALTFDAISGLCEGVLPNRPLPTLLLGIPGDEEEVTKILVYLLRCRTSGFMVAMPATEAVSAALDRFEELEDSVPVVQTVVEGNLEDSRGRKFGRGQFRLADFPVESAVLFSRGPALRGQAAAGIHRIKVQDVFARPAARNTLELADAWIKELADQDESMGEYLTAPEEAEEFAEDDGSADIIARLQARVLELESQAASPVAVHHEGQLPLHSEPSQRPVPPTQLFEAGFGGSQLDAGAMAKLKQLAGPPPGRLSRGATSKAAAAPATKNQNLFAEVEAEAVNDDEIDVLASGSQDPLARILALQMQQTAALVGRLSGKSGDPITNALGSESGNSNANGVKGCMAREAFVKTLEDVVGTGRTMMKNAAADLGLAESQVSSGMMRQYVERRMPLGDHRLLSYFAQFLACSWQAAFEAQEEYAMGQAVRGLMMIEQISLDGGRTQFGWLLTGMVEPNLSLISMNKKRLGLKPYSKLAAAPWIAGNIAYLRDLDFLESRLKARVPDRTEEPKGDEENKKSWPRKKKNKQQVADQSDSAAV